MTQEKDSRENTFHMFRFYLNEIANKYPESMADVYSLINLAHKESIETLKDKNRYLSDLIVSMAAVDKMPKTARWSRHAILCHVKNFLQRDGFDTNGAVRDKNLYEAVCADLKAFDEKK